MQPPAHRKPSPEQEEYWRVAALERELFIANLDLVLEHERDILSCDEYFFCRPEFTHYGVYSNGHINVGTLLLGWRDGLFIDKCQAVLGPRKEKYSCGGKSYVYRFGGLLSRTGWGGFCTSCGNTEFVWDGTLTFERMHLASSANKQFKDRVEGLEEYEGQNFSFGKEALVLARKTRPVTRSLVEMVTVPELVKELQAGEIRGATGKDKTLLKEYLTIENGEGMLVRKIKLIESQKKEKELEK